MSTPPIAPDEGARAVAGPETIASLRLQVLAAARYKLAIHLPTLSAGIFSSQDELAELRRIASLECVLGCSLCGGR